MKLIRCGATVLLTSRFPLDTAKRFLNHPEYKASKEEGSIAVPADACLVTKDGYFDKNKNFKSTLPWANRIHIFGSDFRDISNLEKLLAHITRNFSRLDGIVNNAAQVNHFPSSNGFKSNRT